MHRDLAPHYPFRPLSSWSKASSTSCVTNIPAAVPHTSTLALTNATCPDLLKLANMGANAAIRQDAGIAQGVKYLAEARSPASRSPTRSSATGSPLSLKPTV